MRSKAEHEDEGKEGTDLLQVGHSRREGGWPLAQVEDWQATTGALMAA